MKVKLTANARRRLQQIRDYHKEQGNAAKSRRIGRKILTEAKKLEKYSELGQVEINLESEGKGHRYLLVKPFIFITDIFDTRQDPEKIRP